MSNVLFDRTTLKVVGLNRPALPFEIEILNVTIPAEATTQVSYLENEPKTNEAGEPLYSRVITIGYDDGTTLENTVEITQNDVEYIQGLAPILISVEKFKTVTFESNPEEFTYGDITSIKENQITEGTFYGSGKLFEGMEEYLFNSGLSSFRADLGFGFISLPPDGEVRTVKVPLPVKSKTVGFKIESSDTIDVQIGDLVSNLTPLNSYNEVTLSQEASDVYVLFKNNSDKRIDIYSFALLV